MYINTTGISFHNNIAPFGNIIYVHVSSSCDNFCLNNSIIVGTTVTSSRQRKFVEYINQLHVLMMVIEQMLDLFCRECNAW